MADLVQGLGLLDKFSLIFPFLFVLVIVYAVLSYIKFMGDNKGVHALIALVLALMTLLAPTIRETINVAAPWFVLLFIFFIFAMLGFMIFGIKEGDIVSVMSSKEYKYISFWIMFLIVIIALGSLFHVTAGEGGLTQENIDEVHEGDATGVGTSAFWSIIVHPKVLGMIVILLIGLFTIQRLSYTST